MEIILHIGPHKTGTTSIQEFLGQCTSVPINGTFYPPPLSSGPGHALLAWQTLGIRYDIATTNSLKSLIKETANKGIKQLILSSEEFSYAFFKGMDELARAFSGHSIHLICTFTALNRRVCSVWQEDVKHGACYGQSDIPTYTVNLPGLQPNLVQRFIDCLDPAKVSVILIDSSDSPTILLDTVRKIIGISNLPPAAAQKLNVSLGIIEIETLRAFNIIAEQAELSSTSSRIMRQSLIRFFSSETWQKCSKKIPITIDDESIKRLVEKLTRDFYLEIKRLKNDSRVRVYGNLQIIS